LQEYDHLIIKLNNKFNAVDLYRTHYGKKAITFGLDETVLTHKADHGSEQCLDYVFEIYKGEIKNVIFDNLV
jgi:predicted HAD superfamily phosphohydrolase YqeG